MSRLTIHTVDTAPDLAKPRVETALKNNGFLPNLIGVLANAPTALEMYQEVGAINAKTSLTAAEREVVQITAAVTNGCGFCVAGHCALSTKKNLMSAELIDALRHTSALNDAKLNQLAQFTLDGHQCGHHMNPVNRRPLAAVHLPGCLVQIVPDGSQMPQQWRR